MIKQVRISTFSEVRGIVSVAERSCCKEIHVSDRKGSIANAKSILGMMSLDYSRPVKIICDDVNTLDTMVNTLKRN